jgi:hypothetical protein
LTQVVLRVRLIDGDRLDVTVDCPAAQDQDGAVEHAVAALTDPSGVLRCRHANRDVVLFSRGVAALEVAPLGPVL